MISIVICTYNRASSLAKTLETLRQMTVPPDLAWELIVVDNNSNDNTCGIVEEFARTSGLEVRYIFEPAQGLDRARNVGIMKARGEIVAFVDDDVLVTEDWMANVWREFNSDSDLGLLGGRVELADSRDLPMTIRTSTTRTVVRSFLNAEQFIVGCSWAFRCSVLEGVG
jgi:glycosyltransferase involved in cell wall biosynthesis